MVMSETLPLASVKARFSELVDRVQRQQDRVVVTRNGQPAAVLISTDDLESLEETLAVMSDQSLTRQIRASQQAVTDGEPGSVLAVGNPVKLSKMAEGPETRVPWLGEHTDEVLREELALTDAEIAALRADGAIG